MMMKLGTCPARGLMPHQPEQRRSPDWDATQGMKPAPYPSATPLPSRMHRESQPLVLPRRERLPLGLFSLDLGLILHLVFDLLDPPGEEVGSNHILDLRRQRRDLPAI